MENNSNPMVPQNQSQIAGAILIVGILIAGAILLRGNMPTKQVANTNNPNTQVVAELPPVSASDHIIGSASAKVVIVEYSDTECPFCKVYHNTLHDIVTENNGQVAWVYRHFPIDSLHPKAFHEAEATECAYEQGGNEMFWRYIDEVFARTESNNKLDVAELPKIAADLKLDMEKFNTCLESGKFADKIEGQITEAQNSGARGTPASFIIVKGKVVGTVPGAVSKAKLQAQLDTLLK